MSVLSLIYSEEEQERLQANLPKASHAEFLAELQRGWNVKRNLGVAAQARMFQASQRLTLAHHETLGQGTMALDARFAKCVELAEGGETLRDPGFREYVRKKYPLTDIQTRSQKTTVVHPGLPSSASLPLNQQ